MTETDAMKIGLEKAMALSGAAFATVTKFL